MSETDRGNPIQVAVIALLIVGGGWYFLRNYEIDGLDEISVNAKGDLPADEQSYITYRDTPAVANSQDMATLTGGLDDAENPFTLARRSTGEPVPIQPVNARAFKNIRIASWALDGFGPTKLSNTMARKNLARVVRQFDIVALQQIASIERDLIPRLVEVINEGQNRYDFVIGQPVGPSDRPEQLAFIFDTTSVQVDRRQTYTLADPDDQFSFDPLVAWFRAAKPPISQAWTFSLVNVRVDLREHRPKSRCCR